MKKRERYKRTKLDWLFLGINVATVAAIAYMIIYRIQMQLAITDVSALSRAEGLTSANGYAQPGGVSKFFIVLAAIVIGFIFNWFAEVLSNAWVSYYKKWHKHNGR